MQILQIILYNRQGETRIVPFHLGETNIITGESKSGKTALIDIIDYCLGSKSCNIAKGIIRRTVSYFAILLHFDDEQIFIARENPSIRNVDSVSSICLLRNVSIEDIPAYENIEPNFNRDGLKDFLSRKINIAENLHFPDSLSREPLEANFRHARLFCYQPQDLIAQRSQLFYKQNEQFEAQSIKDTLPYFLGAINEDNLQIENELTRLKKKLNQLKREKREEEKIKTEGVSKAFSLIEEAKEIGLIEKNTSIDKTEKAYEILERLSQWEYKPLEPKSENSALKELIENRKTNQIELGRIEDTLKAANDFLRNNNGYSDEIRQQEIRLESIGLFDESSESDIDKCPLCANHLEIVSPSINAINQSLSNIKKDLKNTKRENPRLQSYIDSVNQQKYDVEFELRKIEKSIAVLYDSVEKAKTLRDLNIRRGKVIGRISLFLENVPLEAESSKIDNEIQKLQSQFDELSEQLDNENKEERLLSILNKINAQMTKWAEKLDIEYRDSPIRFDLKKLTLFVDTPEDAIALRQVGSGANWVSYHLLIMFALHQHFIQRNRPVPRFIVIDQPTQVYYPPENNEQIVEISTDEKAVHQMFDFMIRFAKTLAPKFQIIITDHAYLQNEEFISCVREVWRDGLKLIPEEWDNENQMKV